MKISTILDFLNKNNIPPRQWYRNKKIKKIKIKTESGDLLEINKRCLEGDRLYFDIDNELLFIKNFKTGKIISDEFSILKCQIKNSYISVPLNLLNNMKHPGVYKRIKAPKIGDYVYSVDKTTKKVNWVAEIESMVNNSGNMYLYFSDYYKGNLKDAFFCWADYEQFHRADQNTEEDHRNLKLYEEENKNTKVDYIIDTNSIEEIHFF